MKIEISSVLNSLELGQAFGRRGRLHIPEFLSEESALHLSEVLKKEKSWNLVTFANGKHRDYSYEQMMEISENQSKQFFDIVHSEARAGFQYLYANFPIFDAYHNRKLEGHPLAQLYEFLNSPPFLGLMRKVTGLEDITFCDAQATRFSQGHFLTSHSDDIAGKNRRAAYVLNLTPFWRTDWGGLLQFSRPDGHISQAFMPSFNAINIFKVPQMHSVSCITPFAGASRYSITGWLRAGEPDHLSSRTETT